MKKLKLQVQISADGFVGGPNGELDWMVWNWDDKLKKYVNDLTDSVDTILLGKNMTDGFVAHWSNIVDNLPDDESHAFAKKMVDYPKFVFSKTLSKSNWKNTELAKGELTDQVNKLKAGKGKDLVVYGGATFVSSLIQADLVDEYYLFVNPVVIGKGLSIFKELTATRRFKLDGSVAFDCGIVLLKYLPA